MRVPKVSANGISHPHAFTLFELFVVTILLAFVIALIAPAFPGTRGRRTGAARVACSANLRGIAQASLTYESDDPGERVIPQSSTATRSAMLAYAYGGKAGFGSGGVESIWGNRRRMGSVDRPLNRVLYSRLPVERSRGAGLHRDKWLADSRLELDIYRCPGDEQFPGMHHRAWREEGLSSYDHYGTSFAANILFAYDDELPEALLSISPYDRPLSAVPKPSNTVLLMENAARFAFLATDHELRAGHDPLRLRDDAELTAHGWHKHDWQFNIAFADGHASLVEVRGDNRQSSRSVRQGTARAPGDLRVRGLGWQLDVLPAVPVLTAFAPEGTSPIQTGDPDDPRFDVVE